MNVYIETCTPQFENDIMDAVRIFRYDAEVTNSKDDAQLMIFHEEDEQDGKRTCRIRLEGVFSGHDKTCENIYPGLLEEKRFHKRQIKRSVYGILKDNTHFQPPWGSLTGVRPMRLYYADLEKGLSDQEILSHLHDTFDITPEKLRLLQMTAENQSKLPRQGKNETDIYVGIPFCISRCAYCTFLSGEIGKGTLVQPYVDALIHELDAVCTMIEEAGISVRAVYVGGGTPTALPAPQLKRVLDALGKLTSKAKEFTVEAGRPDTCDKDRLTVIRDSGAGRISINPQTMHDSTLSAIGRRHTCRDTEEAYNTARQLQFRDINMDLIAGLPGETLEMFNETLQWSRTLAPESLSIHTLSIKHASLLRLWKASLPDGEIASQMVSNGFEEAKAQGMLPYYLYRQKNMAGNLENVGYAKPGFENLYNIGMMEEISQVIAAGAGGISKCVNTASGKILRAPNVSDIQTYIKRIDEMIERKRQLMKIINQERRK